MAFPPARMLLGSALLLTACGSEPPPAPPDAAPLTEGPHFTYVVGELSMPATTPQAIEFGLDLNGDRAVDNQLGMVLAALTTAGIKHQDATTRAIDTGNIILLLDLQTRDFSNTDRVGVQSHSGNPATAMPAPCSSASDPLCRRHLAGTGSFDLTARFPDHDPIIGQIAGGTFQGGPSGLSLELALTSSTRIQLDLIGARVKASGISEAGMDQVILAGALPRSELDSKFIPAIHATLTPTVASDCTGTGADCGCLNPSTGRTILELFDTMPKDCNLALDEIRYSQLLRSPLSPDLTIGNTTAISFGARAKAVRAAIR